MDEVFVAKTPEGEFVKYWALAVEGKCPELSFTIDASVSSSGLDGYSVSLRDGKLEITGSNLRSLYYAVYDFFRRLGCRWYWDGDSIPEKKKLGATAISFREESRFAYRGIRYFAHRGLTRFQAEHWGPVEWKREIDWCLKNRLNLFMPRIGMDDTWQKAFPEIVPYPDPKEPIPEATKGFDDRSLFWSLEYRGELRRRFTAYADSLGLSMPVDFGTMTHWYSRTPKAFLNAVKPSFLPQASGSYADHTGYVFDVRDPSYYDTYWHLTQAFIDAGYGKPELLHTIGLGERMVYSDRGKNLQLKIDVIKHLCDKAACECPDAKVLLAGWDFYYTWKPEEVRALLPELDPSRTVVFDYEADARDTDYNWITGEMNYNDFTKWGVVGKFPYVFGIFLCYESGLDIRANYELIAERQKSIRNDEMCKGYILWPESSHTDILCLEYFTANAWNGESAPVGALLKDLCEKRYGADAEPMERAWNLLVQKSSCVGWGENCVQQLLGWLANYSDAPYDYPPFGEVESFAELAPMVYRELAALEWELPAVCRDSVDLARTACDRLNLFLRQKLFRSFDCWTRGEGDASVVVETAEAFEREAVRLADILELHTDYSVFESMERLDETEKIQFKGFGRTLKDNSSVAYCRSHQYELVRYWYVPLVTKITGEIRRRIDAGQKQSLNGDPLLKDWNSAFNAEYLDTPLESMKPTSRRDRDNFVKAIEV